MMEYPESDIMIDTDQRDRFGVLWYSYVIAST